MLSPRIKPALKGLITALVMMGFTLYLYYSKTPASSYLQYVPFFLYAAGIVWTLVAYRKSPAFVGKFGELFGQGFKCFVIVILLMIAFSVTFISMHPEFKEENAKAHREQLIKEKSTLPLQIEEEVATFKKQFMLKYIRASIFGYLVFGAAITAAVSAGLTKRDL